MSLQTRDYRPHIQYVEKEVEVVGVTESNSSPSFNPSHVILVVGWVFASAITGFDVIFTIGSFGLILFFIVGLRNE